MKNKNMNRNLAMLFATLTILLQGCGSQTAEKNSESTENSTNVVDVTYDEYGNVTYVTDEPDKIIDEEYELVTKDIGEHTVIKQYDYESTNVIDVPYGYKLDNVKYGDEQVNYFNKIYVSYTNVLPVELKKHKSNNENGYVYEDNFGTIITDEENRSNQYIDEETGNIVFKAYTHFIIIKRGYFSNEETYEIPESYKTVDFQDKILYYVAPYSIAIYNDGIDCFAINEVDIEVPGYYDEETGKYVYDQNDYGTPVERFVRERN